MADTFLPLKLIVLPSAKEYNQTRLWLWTKDMDGIFAKLAKFYGVRYTTFRCRLVWALSFSPFLIALFIGSTFDVEFDYGDIFPIGFPGFLFVWAIYWILKFVIRAYPKD